MEHHNQQSVEVEVVETGYVTDEKGRKWRTREPGKTISITATDVKMTEEEWQHYEKCIPNSLRLSEVEYVNPTEPCWPIDKREKRRRIIARRRTLVVGILLGISVTCYLLGVLIGKLLFCVN